MNILNPDEKFQTENQEIFGSRFSQLIWLYLNLNEKTELIK